MKGGKERDGKRKEGKVVMRGEYKRRKGKIWDGMRREENEKERESRKEEKGLEEERKNRREETG
jgi:hypothetical protein